MAQMNELMDDYIIWLKKEIIIENKDGYHIITLPYTDLNNDYIQIYSFVHGDKISLSDDGYTLANLQLTGVILTSKRMETIEKICKNHSVTLKDEEIYCEGTSNHFPQCLHLLIQAILQINDMQER